MIEQQRCVAHQEVAPPVASAFTCRHCSESSGVDYLSIRQHRPYLASVYLVEFNQPAQATAAKLPQDVVERAKEMLRAVADTAEQIDRVAVPALPADEIELMLHMVASARLAREPFTTLLRGRLAEGPGPSR